MKISDAGKAYLPLDTKRLRHGYAGCGITPQALAFLSTGREKFDRPSCAL